MNYPDLVLLTAQTRAADAEGALYVCQLALLNALAALKMAEPHMPTWKMFEIQTTIDDCVYALDCAENIGVAA